MGPRALIMTCRFFISEVVVLWVQLHFYIYLNLLDSGSVQGLHSFTVLKFEIFGYSSFHV